MAVSFTLNGKAVQLNVPDDMPLLWAIRDIVGLTGTKFGCGMAQCGACTMHVDGEPVRSCSLPVADAKGKKVTTIEGLASKPAKAVQAAWQKLDVPLKVSGAELSGDGRRSREIQADGLKQATRLMLLFFPDNRSTLEQYSERHRA